MSYLPPSTISIRDGQVVEISNWTLWNGEPFETVSVKRVEEGYEASVGDPEHGGYFREGTDLADVLPNISWDRVRQYERLFDATDLTQGKLRCVFPEYEIVVI